MTIQTSVCQPHFIASVLIYYNHIKLIQDLNIKLRININHKISYKLNK